MSFSETQSENIVRGVGAFVYSKSTNRFLFLLRNTSRYSGMWGLVGGKIELNETLSDALYREIGQEIGFIPKHNTVIPIELFTSEDRYFIFYTYLIIVEHEFVPFINMEHQGYCWTTLESHPLPLHPGVKVTLQTRELLAKIKFIQQS